MHYVRGGQNQNSVNVEWGLWGFVVSQWLSHSWPTFFGLRDRRDFYDLYMGRWLYGRVARHDCWVKSAQRGQDGGRGYYQHLHVDCTQTNTQRDTQKVHRKSWPECIRFCFMFLFYFIYNIGCCCCCLPWYFLCLTGLAFERLSKAHLTLQCECTHECFSEAPSPSSSTLPSLLFNVY